MAMNRKERRAAAKQDRAGGKGTSAAQMAKIHQAIAFAQAGDLAQAESVLDGLRKNDPNQAEVNHQLGMIYARTGRTEAGLELLRKAVEAVPQESLYWNNLAAASLAIERSQEAVEAAAKALALDPKNFLAWQNLALGQRDLGDRAGAVEAFDRAAALGSLDAGTLASWGECLGAVRRFAEAETVVRRALAAAPDDPAILTLLGWLLSELGKGDEARETFRRSLELKADQFLAAFNYAILSIRAGENEVGLRWLRRATSIDPKSATAWRVLALELARQDLKDEALPVAERSLRLAPDDTEIQKLIRKLKGEEADDAPIITIDFGDTMPPPAAGEAKVPEAKPLQGSGVFDLSVVKIGNDD